MVHRLYRGLLKESSGFLRRSGTVFAVLSLLLGAQAFATPIVEAPWRPLPGAYRTSLFLANLTPKPWEAVAATWRAQGLAAGGSPLERAREMAGPKAVQAVEAAIANQDAQSLFEAATRLLALAIADRLEQAEAAIGQPRGQHLVDEGKAIYRAFADGIRSADAVQARRLARAWLDLSSAVGSAGLFGRGAVVADLARFQAARSLIETYVLANYAPDTFVRRQRFEPLPEVAFRDQADIKMPAWLPPGAAISDQTPLPMLELNFERDGIDEKDLPPVAYGDMLFDSPLIFGEPARSLGIACSTCHNRSDVNRDFFIPGLSHRPGGVDVDSAFFNPIANDRRDDPLDIPSLRGIRLTGPYGRDGRSGSLRDFVRNVIVNEFGGAEPTPFMLDALVVYMREFDFLPNSKLTADGRLTAAASEAARRGEALFRRPFSQMDGRSCASCHVPSASFLDRQAHDVGSARPGYDGDRSGAFDTPTLLGARFTAPYMHDGVLPTLASVVGWFDERYALGLTEDERGDLTAYLEAVGDADEPYQRFDGRETAFRLTYEELTTFASSLTALLPRRDREHTLLLIDTVAADLAADASAMTNQAAKPDVYELSNILNSVGAAIRDDDWSLAEARWEAFVLREAALAEKMY